VINHGARCASKRGSHTLYLATVSTLAAIVLLCVCAPARSDGDRLLDRLPPVWRDDSGRTLELSALRGQRIVLTMAYTSCRRTCPLTMERLQQLQRSLDAHATVAQFLIVGYDPGNDRPVDWHRYRLDRHLLRDNWHFVTGSPQDTERLARLLGFEFWRYDEHVMHDFRIVALSEDGALQAVVDSSHGDLRSLL